MPSLLPGSSFFLVTELCAYEPSGLGEHLWLEIEKRGLTTDMVAEQLARVLGRPRVDVGYAGRKDRHATTRQWFSVLRGEPERLDRLSAGGSDRSIEVLRTSRHGNKLRRGHLRGNRFRLGLAGATGAQEHESLAQRLGALAHDGLRNRFGPQRFGFGAASLEIARAWARRDYARAIEYTLDASGAWTLKDPLPSGYRHGADGRVLGALRRDASDLRRAFHAAGPAHLKLIASAGQSAIFNAVLDAREQAGLLYAFREGDLGRAPSGAIFRCGADELEATNRRAMPGVLDAATTGPLPGSRRQRPDAAIDAEEREWSAAVALDWACFERGGALESPGDRRALIVPFLEPPELEPGAGGATQWLSFALPSGSYATEVLAQSGITVPDDRSAPV